jgi:hypothetical protein
MRRENASAPKPRCAITRPATRNMTPWPVS